MQCREAKSLLVDALTRSLSGGETLALDDHVASCESCADAARHADADREALAFLQADAATIETHADFDATVVAKLAAANARRAPRPARHWSSRMRWAIPTIAAAAALATFLITRPLDDATNSPQPSDSSPSVAMRDDDALIENETGDALGLGDDAAWAAAPDHANDDGAAGAAFAEVFSREEIAYLDSRADDAEGDEIANEISEMTDEAAHGLESALDAAGKTKSG